MSTSQSPMTGILKFIGAFVISMITLTVAMFIAGTISPGAETLGSHRWMTGMILTMLGMAIGITATYAPNPRQATEAAKGFASASQIFFPHPITSSIEEYEFFLS